MTTQKTQTMTLEIGGPAAVGALSSRIMAAAASSSHISVTPGASPGPFTISRNETAKPTPVNAGALALLDSSGSAKSVLGLSSGSRGLASTSAAQRVTMATTPTVPPAPANVVASTQTVDTKMPMESPKAMADPLDQTAPVPTTAPAPPAAPIATTPSVAVEKNDATSILPAPPVIPIASAPVPAPAPPAIPGTTLLATSGTVIASANASRVSSTSTSNTTNLTTTTANSATHSAEADQIVSQSPTATGDISIAELVVNGQPTATTTAVPGASPAPAAGPQPFDFGAMSMASTISIALDYMAMATGS